MEKTHRFDVIIVGGGIVGASLALALSDSNLTIALLDKGKLKASCKKPTSTFSPRVSALTEASINLFKNLDIWPSILNQRVCPYRYMRVWDSEGTGAINFDADTVTKNAIGYIVENDVIHNTLLSELKNTTVSLYESQPEVTFDLDTLQKQVVLDDGIVLNGKLLVAADGAESCLRVAADIISSQKDYMHHCIVTTVETEQYHNDTAWQIFLDTGPLAFLPLPSIKKKHYCSIVWSLVPDQAERIMALDNSTFCELLQEAFEKRLGHIIHTEPRLCFPLKQRHALNYYRKNVVLVGDAAHTIHPLAGQGLNLGLMDVAVLTEEILRAHRRQDDIAGYHILARYQRRRKGHNITMIKAMAGFQHLFAANNLTVRWLRNSGLKAINNFPFLKELIIRQAIGISNNSPELVKTR
ncbi:MAG: FAD-dependent oxidoreductase [Candidatus Endonucleobacter sp. (ex Gigantidas childressi)]|nr:FAD-dependent oxidoreductase [Candidatus Endonucleobacter sp. (ex Gigantidas childressi)]